MLACFFISFYWPDFFSSLLHFIYPPPFGHFGSISNLEQEPFSAVLFFLSLWARWLGGTFVMGGGGELVGLGPSLCARGEVEWLVVG